MKKIIIAIIAVITVIAVAAQSAEYPVNMTIPVKKEVVTTVTNVTESVTASVFVLERFAANVESTNVTFVIHGSYRDAQGKVIKRKIIPITMERAAQMMPSIGDVMTDARMAVEANIGTMLAE